MNDLFDKPHVKNHPLFKNRKAKVEAKRDRMRRHSQMLDFDNNKNKPNLSDVFSARNRAGVLDQSQKLPDLIRTAVVTARDSLDQFDFPIPPELKYLKTKNVKRAGSGDDVLSGTIVLLCKFATVGGLKQSFEVPVNVVAGKIVPPSVVHFNGTDVVLAQSSINAMVQRASSYELMPVREMYDPPLTRDERAIVTEMRNEIGYQPREGIGPISVIKRNYSRKSAYIEGWVDTVIADGNYILIPDVKIEEGSEDYLYIPTRGSSGQVAVLDGSKAFIGWGWSDELDADYSDMKTWEDKPQNPQVIKSVPEGASNFTDGGSKHPPKKEKDAEVDLTEKPVANEPMADVSEERKFQTDRGYSRKTANDDPESVYEQMINDEGAYSSANEIAERFDGHNIKDITMDFYDTFGSSWNLQKYDWEDVARMFIGALEDSGEDYGNAVVHLDNLDHDDGMVTVTAQGPGVKTWAGKDRLSIAGTYWEQADGPEFVYAIISDSPDLISELKSEGYNVNDDEYVPPIRTAKGFSKELFEENDGLPEVKEHEEHNFGKGEESFDERRDRMYQEQDEYLKKNKGPSRQPKNKSFEDGIDVNMWASKSAELSDATVRDFEDNVGECLASGFTVEEAIKEVSSDFIRAGEDSKEIAELAEEMEAEYSSREDFDTSDDRPATEDELAAEETRWGNRFDKFHSKHKKSCNASIGTDQYAEEIWEDSGDNTYSITHEDSYGNVQNLVLSYTKMGGWLLENEASPLHSWRVYNVNLGEDQVQEAKEWALIAADNEDDPDSASRILGPKHTSHVASIGTVVPAGYAKVKELMDKAQEEGKDTFPRAWVHILQNYILEVVSTASQDSWLTHLVNDGYAINPYGPNRGRDKTAQVEEDDDSDPDHPDMEKFMDETMFNLDKTDQGLSTLDNEAYVYPNTKTPMEPGDSVKFQGNEGPIRGTVVEVDQSSGKAIVKARGYEYRVALEDIMPMNSTFKKMYANSVIRLVPPGAKYAEIVDQSMKNPAIDNPWGEAWEAYDKDLHGGPVDDGQGNIKGKKSQMDDEEGYNITVTWELNPDGLEVIAFTKDIGEAAFLYSEAYRDEKYEKADHISVLWGKDGDPQKDVTNEVVEDGYNEIRPFLMNRNSNMPTNTDYHVLYRGFDCQVTPTTEGQFNVSLFEGGSHVFSTDVPIDLSNFESDEEIDDNANALIDEAAQAAVDMFESQRGTLGQGAGVVTGRYSLGFK